MDDYPDDIAYVARRRQEGAKELRIAEELGLEPDKLRIRIQKWERANPTAMLPAPVLRPKTPYYVQAAALRREEGLTDRQIAARMGKSLTTVHIYLTKARAAGLLPPRGHRERGGRLTWAHYRNKGAAARLGSITRILDDLTAEQVEYLLQNLTQDDATLADLLARIVKEHLDAQQAPK